MVSYIKENNLEEYLEKLHKKIKEYFGDRKQYLFVQYNPEVKNERMLWVDIEIKELSVSRVREIMEKFEDEWYLDNLKNGVGVDTLFID